MVGEVIGIGVCLLLWGARAYLATKYLIKYKVAGEVRWAWKRGTPDWVTRAMPVLESLGWAAVLGLIVWWLFRAIPIVAALALAMCISDEVALGCSGLC